MMDLQIYGYFVLTIISLSIFERIFLRLDDEYRKLGEFAVPLVFIVPLSSLWLWYTGITGIMFLVTLISGFFVGLVTQYLISRKIAIEADAYRERYDKIIEIMDEDKNA